MNINLEIEYIYTAPDGFTIPQRPRFVYSLPLHHETFVADCSNLPEFEE